MNNNIILYQFLIKHCDKLFIDDLLNIKCVYVKNKFLMKN